MRTITAVTWEIDDMDKAAEELLCKARELDLGKASVGIVYCDVEADLESLGALLNERLGIEIIGVTTTTAIEKNEGFCDMNIVLTVITGDDVSFAVGETGPLTLDNYAAAIREAYNAAAAALSCGSVKLVLALTPYIASLTSEHYVEALDAASGGVPVFGGVATDHWDLAYQKTFHNGSAFGEGLVFLLISGNVKPVFAMEHNFASTVEHKAIVTKSSGNMVERVDNIPFIEYLATFGPVPNEESVIFHYQATPFSVELPDYIEGEMPVIRALSTLDHEKSAGGFLSKIPVGSKMSMNVLQKNNLETSCRNTLSMVLEKMEANADYNYSLILVTTCNARYLVMGDAKRMESEILTEMLSGRDDINAMGFYAFGEFCPTSILEDGNAVNRFHNFSVTVCAI